MNKFNDITILLTGVGAPGAPGIIKCLKKNGERNIKIIGVDMNKEAGGKDLTDNFYTVPPAYDTNFIECIKKICIKERVRIIIPIVTKELIKFSHEKNKFKELGIDIAVMDEDVLNIANDKGKLLTSLRVAGFKVPDFDIVNNINDLKSSIVKLGYPKNPVCIKITNGNGSRGLRIINPYISRYEMFLNNKPNSVYTTYENLISILAEVNEIPELMVMEYLPGKEFSVDVLADNGEVLCMRSRYNSLVINSIPINSVITKTPFLDDEVRKIVEYLKLDGNIGFDYKCDSFNHPMLMEINPRLTATIVFYAPAGINFPYLGLKKILGEPVVIPDNFDYGLKMRRRWQEIYEDKYGNIIDW